MPLLDAYDIARPPNEYLKASENCLRAGDHDAGSIYLWQAVAAAMVRLAKEYGQPHSSTDDLALFADFLDRKYDCHGWHVDHFLSANAYGDNPLVRFLPWDEMEDGVEVMHQFVQTLTGYRKQEV